MGLKIGPSQGKEWGHKALCDFKNLNVSSLKDKNPFPNMQAMLKKVIGCEFLSMMDGFFGYNQVVFKESKQYKIAFTTPWGIYIYVRIPFVLKNIGATFQRAMDVAFYDLIEIFLAIYQDDLTA
jgi:hypothetical protein